MTLEKLIECVKKDCYVVAYGNNKLLKFRLYQNTQIFICFSETPNKVYENIKISSENNSVYLEDIAENEKEIKQIIEKKCNSEMKQLVLNAQNYFKEINKYRR